MYLESSMFNFCPGKQDTNPKKENLWLQWSVSVRFSAWASGLHFVWWAFIILFYALLYSEANISFSVFLFVENGQVKITNVKMRTEKNYNNLKLFCIFYLKWKKSKIDLKVRDLLRVYHHDHWFTSNTCFIKAFLLHLY